MYALATRHVHLKPPLIKIHRGRCGKVGFCRRDKQGTSYLVHLHSQALPCLETLVIRTHTGKHNDKVGLQREKHSIFPLVCHLLHALTRLETLVVWETRSLKLNGLGCVSALVRTGYMRWLASPGRNSCTFSSASESPVM